MDTDIMNKFDFLLGDWNMEYRIPKSIFSEAGTDSGTGSFKKILDGKYVFFEYSTRSGGAANGIFAWDDKVKIYRYWWFENSGNFQAATCSFINDETLAMNWHDTVLIQSFTQTGSDEVLLDMGEPDAEGVYKSVLQVCMKRL